MLLFIQSFLLELLNLLGQMAPYLVLGFIFAGILHVFVPRKTVARYLGKESVGSAVKASVIGVPMPLCSCGVVPTAMGLRKRGASRAAVVSFLISTPQTGLDSIFATYGFFGWAFAIFRPVAAFISGIAGGVATLLLRPAQADDARWEQYHVPAEDALAGSRKPDTFIGKLRNGARFAFLELLGDIALWLVVGLAVAAAISMAIPDDFFADRLPGGFAQMLVMKAFGVPLYVCSTASIPIAAVLMSKGISAGAAFVFLMTGPATNAATLLIISRVMGWRVLAMYLASITLLALGFGLGLDALVSGTDLGMDPHMLHEHMLPGWITWGSAGLVTFFVVLHFMRSLERRIAARRLWMADGKGVNLIVEGMNCSHCASTVTQSLKSVPGVKQADVSLETGQVHVEGEDLDRERLEAAVEGVGYRIKRTNSSV